MTTNVALPPGLYHPTRKALQDAGKEATPEQVVDLLVALGVAVLELHPDLMGRLDLGLIGEPWPEHATIGVPAVRSRAMAALAADATAIFGRPVGRAAAVRLAAAAGAAVLSYLPA